MPRLQSDELSKARQRACLARHEEEVENKNWKIVDRPDVARTGSPGMADLWENSTLKQRLLNAVNKLSSSNSLAKNLVNLLVEEARLVGSLSGADVRHVVRM